MGRFYVAASRSPSSFTQTDMTITNMRAIAGGKGYGVSLSAFFPLFDSSFFTVRGGGGSATGSVLSRLAAAFSRTKHALQSLREAIHCAHRIIGGNVF